MKFQISNFKPDGNDALIAAGLALIAGGAAMWSVPMALVIVGAALFALGLMGAIRKAG